MYSFLDKNSFTPKTGANVPFVTLTFAQSLDGKIAASQGRQLIISGAESMNATHLLRARHDAILVGIGTVLNDDPRLSESPTRPWIFTGRDHDSEKRKRLEALGATVFVIDQDAQNRLVIPHLLRTLGERSIRSLMVEGGASIISTFMASSLVDLVLITIAPIYVGHDGISAVQDAQGCHADGQTPLPSNSIDLIHISTAK
ncbi:2,5-diamino-6-(ribosylamino)-4(3H)-pyrimidinone 5'-phosphate reductase [Podila epigama]|nr:2,5-diamino-6-(ribosylamino)-4(3H)-pyrimidinone 5'-phosphate reductase [Podila epigama]